MFLEQLDVIPYPQSIDECNEDLCGLVTDRYFEVIPVEDFGAFLYAQLESIRRWCRDTELPEEVEEAFQLCKRPAEIAALQSAANYCYMQIAMWAGEIKLRLMQQRLRDIDQALARAADTGQTVFGEVL